MADKLRTALMAAVLALMVAGCSSSLRENLQEDQAEDILALLKQEGMSATKKRGDDGTWSVYLKDSEQTGAEELLRRYDLPRQRHPAMTEVFTGTDLLPSELEEHARYQYALGHELAATIERIGGVLSAHVQVALPRKDAKQADQPRPTASALVRYRSDQRVDLMKSQIRSMIAGGIPGASVDDISVLMQPVYPPAQTAGAGAAGGWFGLGAGNFPGAGWLVLPWLVAAVLAIVVVRRHGLPGHWTQGLIKQVANLSGRRKPGGATGRTDRREPAPPSEGTRT